jgi:molybdenum cofactor cytidylyltransferase
MGALKQTLPWPPGAPAGRATIISSAFDAIAPFCQGMLVVVGSDAGPVLAALDHRRFTRVNADSDDEMFASIRAALRALSASEAEPEARSRVDAVLLQPGDHPGVARETIESLLHAFERDDSKAVLPEYRGKGGHPALIPRTLFERILSFGAGGHPGGDGGGLRQFWIENPEARTRLAVDDQTCVVDLDTRADYDKSMPGNE